MAVQKFTYTANGIEVSEAFMSEIYGKSLVAKMRREARSHEWSEHWHRTDSGKHYAIRVRFNGYKPAPISDTYYEDMRAAMLY